MDNPVSPKTNHKKLLVGALIVLLILAGFFWFLWSKNYFPNKVDQTASKFEVQTTEINKTEALKGFPENLPSEAGGQILQNSESSTNDGRSQSTRKFTSALSAQKALVKYASFFEDLGWIRNSTEVIKSPALFSKDGNILMIVATEDSASKGSILEVSVIQSLKSTK